MAVIWRIIVFNLESNRIGYGRWYVFSTSPSIIHCIHATGDTNTVLRIYECVLREPTCAFKVRHLDVNHTKIRLYYYSRRMVIQCWTRRHGDRQTPPSVNTNGQADINITAASRCPSTIVKSFTSNCQCAACKSCFAWSAAQPAARTNWLIITWCLSSSMF